MSMLPSEPILQSNTAHVRDHDNKADEVLVRDAAPPSVSGSKPMLSTMSGYDTPMVPSEVANPEPKQQSTPKSSGTGAKGSEPDSEPPITSESMRKRNRSQDERAPEGNVGNPFRPKKLTRSVSPPLANTRLSHFVYALVFLSGLLLSYYTWRLYMWKQGGKGGILGAVWGIRRNVPQVHVPGGFGPDIADGAKNHGKKGSHREKVEDKIEDLARVLGMPSKELASAIAIAVREYVPPASLSSIAAQETGAIVDALVTGRSDYVVDPERIRLKREEPNEPGVIDNVASGIGSFVGMEEP